MRHTLFTLLGGLAVVLFTGCSSTYPNRSVVGETFPRAAGASLAGKEMVLPDSLLGQKVILVIGYVQETQFDIDRWSIGFFTADFGLPPVYEVPTIPGLIPSFFKESIDRGMRSGIPRESWADVITVYGSDGQKIAEWTGNEGPRNCRVVLLDEKGEVLWFHDKGFGLPPLKELLRILGRDPKKAAPLDSETRE